MSKIHKTQKVQKKSDKSLEKKDYAVADLNKVKKEKKTTLSAEEKKVDKDAPVDFAAPATTEEKQGTDKKNRRLSKETSKKGSSRAKVQPKSSKSSKGKGDIQKEVKKPKKSLKKK
jgi:hypothetical protein